MPIFFNTQKKGGIPKMELFKLMGTIAISNGDANSAIDETTGKASSASNTMVGAFKKIGAAVAMYFTADKIIDFGTACVETAASVKAMNSQFAQTFSGMEQDATDAIGRVADASNILDSRLQGVGTSIFAFAKTTGMESADALGLMERALQVTADSAAYYDRSLEDTAESLKSFLKGNFENDAALGLSCTETTRNAKANELYGQSFKDLSEAQKQLTLLAMVEEANELSGAMGQAAREGDGWENVMGNLQESWKQFQATVGAPILEAVVPVIQQITEGLSGMDGIADTLGSVFTAIVQPLATIGQAVAPVLLELINTILPVLLDVINMILPPITEIISKLLPVLMGILSPILELLKPILDLLTPILDLVLILLDPIIKLVQTLLPVLISVLEPIIQLFISLITPIIELVSTALEPLMDVLVTLIESVLSILQPILDAIVSLLGAVLTPLIEALMPILEAVLMALSPLLEALTTLLMAILEPLIPIIESVAKMLGSVLGNAINALMPLIEGIIGVFNGLIEFIVGVFTGDWEKAWNGIVELFKGIVNIIPTIFESVINVVIGLINGIIDGINGLTGAVGINVIPKLPEVDFPPLLEEGGVLEKGQVGILEGNGAEAVVPLEHNKKWIASVARDMQVAGIGGGTESQQVLQDILQELKTLNDDLYEKMVDALCSGVKLDIDNREFARLVKGVV
jgi:phage-related protein